VLNEKTQPLPFAAPEPDSERPAPKGPPWDRFLFALFWTLAAMAVIGLLSVLWFRELDRRKDAEKSAAAAQSELSDYKTRLAGLEDDVALAKDELAGARRQLKSWRLRSARRGDALRSTRSAVALVTPLRESYADLDEALTAMNGDADAVAAAAGALQRAVAALNDYVRRTPEDELSKRKLREHVTTLRARAAALGTARAAFVEAQGGYEGAAERVESRFDELTRAIAALRKQINKALRH
jgi:chromosome segregation ATPase